MGRQQLIIAAAAGLEHISAALNQGIPRKS